MRYAPSERRAWCRIAPRFPGCEQGRRRWTSGAGGARLLGRDAAASGGGLHDCAGVCGCAARPPCGSGRRWAWRGRWRRGLLRRRGVRPGVGRLLSSLCRRGRAGVPPALLVLLRTPHCLASWPSWSAALGAGADATARARDIQALEWREREATAAATRAGRRGSLTAMRARRESVHIRYGGARGPPKVQRAAARSGRGAMLVRAASGVQ